MEEDCGTERQLTRKMRKRRCRQKTCFFLHCWETRWVLQSRKGKQPAAKALPWKDRALPTGKSAQDRLWAEREGWRANHPKWSDARASSLLQSHHRKPFPCLVSDSRKKGTLLYSSTIPSTFRGVPQLQGVEASPDEQTQGACCCVGKALLRLKTRRQDGTRTTRRPEAFALLCKSWHHPPDKLLLCTSSTAGLWITRVPDPVLQEASFQAAPSRGCPSLVWWAAYVVRCPASGSKAQPFLQIHYRTLLCKYTGKP